MLEALWQNLDYAASVVLDQIRGMTAGPVTDQELHTSKRSFIDTFPRRFATKTQVANLFAQEEYTGRYTRDPGFWKEFRARIGGLDGRGSEELDRNEGKVRSEGTRHYTSGQGRIREIFRYMRFIPSP